MTAAGWEAQRERLLGGYAADKVRVGSWPADGAPARAERDMAQLLPQGIETPGHHMWSIVNDDGVEVGSLWLGPGSDRARPTCFIFDIVVRPEARGRGYGRAALAALEPIARDLGFEEIGLHVFGGNDVALGLYRTAGYIETDVNMARSLRD